MLDNGSSFISNRADEEGGPKLAAVLSPIENFRSATGAAFEFGQNLCEGIGIVAMGHQKVEALAQNFLSVIPRQKEKGIIGKYYRVVGFFCVRKYHCHPRCLCGDHEWAKLFLKAFDFGFCILLLVVLAFYRRHT